MRNETPLQQRVPPVTDEPLFMKQQRIFEKLHSDKLINFIGFNITIF